MASSDKDRLVRRASALEERFLPYLPSSHSSTADTLLLERLHHPSRKLATFLQYRFSPCAPHRPPSMSASLSSSPPLSNGWDRYPSKEALWKLTPLDEAEKYVLRVGEPQRKLRSHSPFSPFRFLPSQAAFFVSPSHRRRTEWRERTGSAVWKRCEGLWCGKAAVVVEAG
jgi:hypothetical protein